MVAVAAVQTRLHAPWRAVRAVQSAALRRVPAAESASLLAKSAWAPLDLAQRLPWSQASVAAPDRQARPVTAQPLPAPAVAQCAAPRCFAVPAAHFARGCEPWRAQQRAAVQVSAARAPLAATRRPRRWRTAPAAPQARLARVQQQASVLVVQRCSAGARQAHQEQVPVAAALLRRACPLAQQQRRPQQPSCVPPAPPCAPPVLPAASSPLPRLRSRAAGASPR